mmetsp:Transcript_126096/g.315114  ORF Transcript_126096/g.315114 Transcript_126096/m.315114 type:complete len:223 (-) Transcript_126096:1711-2379(-)
MQASTGHRGGCIVHEFLPVLGVGAWRRRQWPVSSRGFGDLPQCFAVGDAWKQQTQLSCLLQRGIHRASVVLAHGLYAGAIGARHDGAQGRKIREVPRASGQCDGVVRWNESVLGEHPQAHEHELGEVGGGHTGSQLAGEVHEQGDAASLPRWHGPRTSDGSNATVLVSNRARHPSLADRMLHGWGCIGHRGGVATPWPCPRAGAGHVPRYICQAAVSGRATW